MLRFWHIEESEHVFFKHGTEAEELDALVDWDTKTIRLRSTMSDAEVRMAGRKIREGLAAGLDARRDMAMRRLLDRR